MVTLIFRAKREGMNSMETVFENLDPLLPPHRNIVVPSSGGSIKSIIKNILFTLKNKSQINHITGEVHYVAIGTGRNTILTIHDIQSVQYGFPVKKFLLKVLWLWIPLMICRKVTVISEFTKKELLQIAPFAGKKVVVIHNAFSPRVTHIKRTFNAKCPTILHMGTNPNKNLERTIDAIKGIPCHLNVIGKLTESQKKILLTSGLSFENHYDVPYSSIIEYYENCDIVSFPSTYEGFGVPILEANAAGRPIIVGDIDVLHEVAGDAACFVNPLSVESIRSGFINIIDDTYYREALCIKGFENIKRFSPELIANQYSLLYESLY